MNFTSTSEIKARVYELYLTEDQELNSNFFDFHVRNLRSTLLKTYAEIQKAINGDAVVLLKNRIEPRHGSEIQVNGILSSWKEIGEIYAENRNGLYDGNYKEFLEEYNGKENLGYANYHRLYNFMAKVINIKWETDGYEIDLPNEVTIPDCFMDSDAGPDVDAISDWLSDMSGWLHDGFEIVE